MKRYEKMDKKEIIASFTDIPFKCEKRNNCVRTSCNTCVIGWLNEEIQMKPRWETIKSKNDIYRLYDEFEVTIPNTEDIHYAYVFAMWLNEEVEI